MLNTCLKFLEVFLGTSTSETIKAVETGRTISRCQFWTGSLAEFSIFGLLYFFFEELAYWFHVWQEPETKGLE